MIGAPGSAAAVPGHSEAVLPISTSVQLVQAGALGRIRSLSSTLVRPMLHSRVHSKASLVLLAILAAPAAAQHAQVSAVAVDPLDSSRVWVCDRDNDSVSRIQTSTGATVQIHVGVSPRSLAVTPDGSRVLVANQRGNVPLEVNFVTPFTGAEIRGTVSVISTATNTVTAELVDVGTEPYGIAIAPNGKWFAVSGFRSGTIKFYDLATLGLLYTHQYQRNLNFITRGTIADHDANRDGVADLADPRGFVIRADSARMYVTHNKSPFVSVLALALDANGLVTGTSLAAKIDLDDYPFDPFYNPLPVQTIESQGLPRFAEDIALSPDGDRALVPHVLQNINHDVGFDFGSALPGAFANRVYPALTMLDAAANSFGQAGDASRRLEHELSEDLTPAEYVPYGQSAHLANGDRLVLGGSGSPLLGGSADFLISGFQPGDSAALLIGKSETSVDMGDQGTLLVHARFSKSMSSAGQLTIAIPATSQLEDVTYYAQARVTSATTGETKLTNAVRFHMDWQGLAIGKMGYRAGHPSRVLFSPSGDHAILLNRGSEDLFLYSVSGSDMRLRCALPRRWHFEERAPFDATTPLGDLPLGMALVPDASTVNDDAILYVINEVTRTLSTLRVDFAAGTIERARSQIRTLRDPDAFTRSQRIGEEIFEDASRAQTAGNFNNSCASCHFEGGADSDVWQRVNGPRSTMPLYGGTVGTGFMLWKATRINMGETGPMFAGENGGTGLFADSEQQGLTDYHEKLAIPLNPNLDPVTGAYTDNAAFGRDLYFGSNLTGLNPTERDAGCAACHPDVETNPGLHPGPRFYTKDFVNPLLSVGETLGQLDPNCFSLRENRLVGDGNIANVNTGCNIDLDGDGTIDLDRNGDGYVDLETYPIMNDDLNGDFRRDDANGYQCPCDPFADPDCPAQDPRRLFTRNAAFFTVPTKLGIFSSAPYFHDHVAYSLRTLLHPDDQALSATYGSPAWGGQAPYPGLNKIFNGEHDIVGHEQFLPGASKVQSTLQSGSLAQAQADMLAILEYIQSL